MFVQSRSTTLIQLLAFKYSTIPVNVSRPGLWWHQTDSTIRTPTCHSRSDDWVFLFSSAAMAAVGDGINGNHTAVHEEESSFLRSEFPRCLQQYTAS